MNRDIANGRMERELRRRQLAVRLINHQARTRTVEKLAGLTRHQIATLRWAAGVPTDSRPRGPAPTSFDFFFSCARTRSESAVLAFLYRVSDASKFGKLDGSSEAAIERGEQLCDLYERWQRLVPGSQMEFEHLTLVGEGVTREDRISFRHCDDCHAILLVDLLGSQRRLCGHCSPARRDAAGRPPNSGKRRDDEQTNLVLYGYQLLAGQLLREHKGRHTFDDGLLST